MERYNDEVHVEQGIPPDLLATEHGKTFAIGEEMALRAEAAHPGAVPKAGDPVKGLFDIICVSVSTSAGNHCQRSEI